MHAYVAPFGMADETLQQAQSTAIGPDRGRHRVA